MIARTPSTDHRDLFQRFISTITGSECTKNEIQIILDMDEAGEISINDAVKAHLTKLIATPDQLGNVSFQLNDDINGDWTLTTDEQGVIFNHNHNTLYATADKYEHTVISNRRIDN